MKTKIFYFSIILCLTVISCKRNSDIQPQSVNNSGQKIQPLKDGNDDDVPILMEKTISHAGAVISGSNITLVNGSDTINGITDENGEHQFNLLRRGIWDLTISHPGYIESHDFVNITDSFTSRTDTLSVQ